jgi:hypothetical protein
LDFLGGILRGTEKHVGPAPFCAADADPEFAARHRERNRERVRKLHADPEFARNRERCGERMRKLNADPEFAARNRERMRKLGNNCPLTIDCPHWVPDSLQSEYFEYAGRDGEHAAARHLRRLLHEPSQLLPGKTACRAPGTSGVTVTFLHCDMRERLRQLPADHFDVVVTSPPYWGLRDYEVAGQISMNISR